MVDGWPHLLPVICKSRLSRWESLPTHFSPWKCNEAVQRSVRRGARWEGHLAPSNARSLFGRLFVVRRFLFACEADFPVFSLCSTRGHGAALDIRFVLFAGRFLFAREADFPVFSFCSTRGHGAALDIRFVLFAGRFLFAHEANFPVLSFCSGGRDAALGVLSLSSSGCRTQKHRNH